MARYELVTTVYDNLEKRELAQAIVEESDDLEEMAEEFQDATGEDFEECRVDAADGDDDSDDAADDDEDSAA